MELLFFLFYGEAMFRGMPLYVYALRMIVILAEGLQPELDERLPLLWEGL